MWLEQGEAVLQEEIEAVGVKKIREGEWLLARREGGRSSGPE